MNRQKKHMSKQGCVIWMHGLGSNAADMRGLSLAPPITALDLHHICLNADTRPVTLNSGMHMQAWYDIKGLKASDKEDREGIAKSKSQIMAVVQEQISAGFLPNQIVVAGFSQGGAMALYTALHSEVPLGGVISLSAYLPLAAECQLHLAKSTPIFIGYGHFDAVVVPQMTQYTEHLLAAQGYNQITLRSYPMEHSICQAEVEDVAHWLSLHLPGVISI